jgi:hypothetical protein
MKTIECLPVEDGLRLSAHELSALLLLREAPVDANRATADVVALERAGLAARIGAESGLPRFAISDNGHALLRALGAG